MLGFNIIPLFLNYHHFYKNARKIHYEYDLISALENDR